MPLSEIHVRSEHSAGRVAVVENTLPVGAERQLARRAAARSGMDPPDWALQPVPEVTVVGPPIPAGTPRQAHTGA